MPYQTGQVSIIILSIFPTGNVTIMKISAKLKFKRIDMNHQHLQRKPKIIFLHTLPQCSMSYLYDLPQFDHYYTYSSLLVFAEKYKNQR